MKHAPLALLAVLAACSDPGTELRDAPEPTVESAVADDAAVEVPAVAVGETVDPSQDISTLPAGLYLSEDTHAYIAFSYDHQGFSNPILRWSEFDAELDLVPDNPTASTLRVAIDPSAIDSGVDEFNDHLRSEDFFHVAEHPEIAFTSTSLSMDTPTTGTLQGDLTMKGVTRPVTLDVELNKVGENFRTKIPMFGISATGQLRRSDYDLGLYAPMVGDEVDLMIEVEFQKAQEGEG